MKWDEMMKQQWWNKAIEKKEAKQWMKCREGGMATEKYNTKCLYVYLRLWKNIQ